MFNLLSLAIALSLYASSLSVLSSSPRHSLFSPTERFPLTPLSPVKILGEIGPPFVAAPCHTQLAPHRYHGGLCRSSEEGTYCAGTCSCPPCLARHPRLAFFPVYPSAGAADGKFELGEDVYALDHLRKLHGFVARRARLLPMRGPTHPSLFYDGIMCSA